MMDLAQPSRVRIAVVLVNFNGAALTLRCITSLRKGSLTPSEIVVVDNASGSDDVALLTAALQNDLTVTLIREDTNVGFGAAVNRALDELANRDLDGVLVLNNDSVVERSCLEGLAQTARENNTKIVVPVVVDSSSGTVWYAGGRANATLRVAKHLGYGKPADTLGGEDVSIEGNFFLCGCAFLVPRRLLPVVRFNPEIFMYWEDVELSLFLRRRNTALVVSTRAVVRHREGGSTGHSPEGHLRRALLRGSGRLALIESNRLTFAQRTAAAIGTPAWLLWEARPSRSRHHEGFAPAARASFATLFMLAWGMFAGVAKVDGRELVRKEIPAPLLRMAAGQKSASTDSRSVSTTGNAARAPRGVSGFRRFVLPAVEYGAWLLSVPTGPLIARALGPSARGDLVVVVMVQFFSCIVPAAGVPLAVKRRAAFGDASAVTSGLRVAALPTALWVVVLVTISMYAPLSSELTRGLIVTAFATPLLVVSAIVRSFLVGRNRVALLATVRLISLSLFTAAVVLLFIDGRLTFAWMAYLNLVPLGSEVFLIAHVMIRTTSERLSRSDRRYAYVGLGSQVSETLLMRGDTIAATALMSRSGLGIYSVAANLAQFASSGAVAVATTHFRALASMPLSDELLRKTRGVAREGALIVLLAGGCLAAVAWRLIPLVYGTEYGGAYRLYLLLLPGLGSMSYAVVVWYSITAHGKPHHVLRAQLETLAAALLLAALLTPLLNDAAVPLAYTLAMFFLVRRLLTILNTMIPVGP